MMDDFLKVSVLERAFKYEKTNCKLEKMYLNIVKYPQIF